MEFMPASRLGKVILISVIALFGVCCVSMCFTPTRTGGNRAREAKEALLASMPPAAKYETQEGDILFQALPDDGMLVKVIEGVSESEYSHCGVVLKEDGDWVVIEAIGEVQKTPLDEWIRRGRAGGKFAAYRLKAEHRKNIPALRAEMEKFMGRPYDYHYVMGDEEIYCSELVFTAYKNVTGEELGELKKLADLNWKPFVLEMTIIEGGTVPLDRKIITPKCLSEAKQLEKVSDGDF